MNKAVVVTGTPGTGKTALTKLLLEQGYSIIEIGKVVKEEGLYDFFDEETGSYVVDDDTLNNYLIEKIQTYEQDLPLIIEGHVAQLPPSYVSHCIVLRCSVRNLRQRLVERDYDEPKIDENVEAEIMEVILTDMLHLYGEDKESVLSTDGAIEETFDQLMSVLNMI